MLIRYDLSIIIVNYYVGDRVYDCLKSIYEKKTKINLEIIVVDNSEEDRLSIGLKKKFPKVKYIKSKRNLGYGAGNNLGADNAKGEYIFILNPDTKLASGKIDILIDFIQKNKKTGAVAPLLVDKNNTPFKLQGMSVLTPIRAIFSLSFIAKLFPKNKIQKEYFLLPWRKDKNKESDIVPGTAFVMSKKLFEKLGGFDENFFLYFEEFDLFKRLTEEGYRSYIIPEVKFSHEWGASTMLLENKDKYFLRSRFYYFKKHYGVLKALFTELFLRINKYTVLLTMFLAFGLILRVHMLSSVMTFIPDMGLFYLPARDMLTQGTIPLVGPETSHPWIHHGAHWTYVLAGLLYISNFDPVFPAYFIAILGTLTVALFYFVVKEMFDRNVAILASMLYATAPLVVMNSRIPYHTSPIPFFVIILFYLTYKWVSGANIWIFPLITFMIGVLYNHEITTFVYVIAIGLISIYGFMKKKVWFRQLLNIKLILASIITYLIPMTPFILHDINTQEYGQTLKFIAWLGYRVGKFPLSLIDPRFKSPGSSPSTIPQFFQYYNDLIVSVSALVSFSILMLTVIYLISYFYKHIGFGGKRYLKIKEKISVSFALLFIFLFIGLSGLATHRVPIEADTLLISPFIIILTSLSILWIFKNKFAPALILVLLFAVLNIYYLFSTNFFTDINGRKSLVYKDKLEASEQVIKLSGGENYNLVGKGPLSDFESFTMPYEYILWWKGQPPSSEDEELKIMVWEKDGNIIVKEMK